MKAFDDLTLIKRENAIKVGTSVPGDGAPISWFTSEEVSPSNNLSILDLSDLIPENRVDNESSTILAYADELGILRDFNNNSAFKTNNLTISNKSLSSANVTQRVSQYNTNANDFIHYFYVSRFFTAGSPGFSLLTMSDFVEPDRFLSLSIKVIDENGFDYIDINSGRKKYRILLEPYLVEANSSRSEIPYRIVVLLDSDYNQGLKLVYDKIEIDDFGNFSNQELRYSEKINPVKYFTEVPEESLAVDYNYQDKRLFSIKKYSQKNAELLSDIRNINGYQIFSPSKAIEDNRSFEVFNWRLIARTNSSINLDEANYGIENNEQGLPRQKDIKVGVLYSSFSQRTLATINPYIFARLENSPFNFSRYSFYNPLNEQSNAAKFTSTYWLVDIDSQEDLTMFDFLAWSPTSSVTNTQAAKVQIFLNNNGTLLLDLSSATSNATQISSLLSVNRNAVRPSTVTTNYDSTLLSRDRSGGWSITSAIFENEAFGIYGSSKIFRSNTNKSYPYFSESSPNNVVSISGGEVSGSKDLLIWLSRSPQSSNVNKNNIIATTFPLMEYCNSIYSVSNPDIKVDENVSDNFSSFNQNQIYSSVVEGPLKFLYNIISYSLYSKSHSNRNIDTRSSLFNFVTQWDSSWVMDQEALLEDEIDEYFKLDIDSNENERYVRQIIPLNKSIVDYYKESLAGSMPTALVQRLSALDYSKVDFFIEVTNPDIEITNATKITSSEADLNSSYALHKVTNLNLPVNAFTLVKSPKLLPYPSTGRYAVVEKPVASSSTRAIRGFFDVANYLKSYNFDLDSGYYYFQARDKSFNLDASLRVSATVNVSGQYYREYTQTVITGWQPDPNFIAAPVAPAPSVTPSSSTGASAQQSVQSPGPRQVPTGTIPCLGYESAIDSGILRAQNSGASENAYLYTNDIELGNSTRQWRQGASGDYVRYIQFTLVNDGFSIAVDGTYGPRTEAAVRQFQTKHNQRYIDGTVDSETKSFFAFKVWKAKTQTQFNAAVTQCRSNSATSAYANSIISYMQAARNSGEASAIGVLNYNKITFTGFAGPPIASDVLFFEIPQAVEKVQQVKIRAGSFNNFKITHYGYGSVKSSNIFASTYRNTTETISINSANEIVINLANLSRAACRYFWLRIEGGALGSRYGFGEGFSISSIVASGTFSQNPPATPVSPPSPIPQPPSSEAPLVPITETIIVPDSENITAQIQVVFNENILNVNPSTPIYLRYDTANLARKPSYSINSISYNSTKLGGQRNFNNPSINFNTTSYSPESYVTINPSSVSSITINSVEVLEVKTEDSIIIPNNSISTSSTTNVVTVETFGTSYYNDTEVQVISNDLENYYLVNDNNVLLNYEKNSISISDGVLRFCDENKRPTGIISGSEIRQLEINGNEEVDYKYGYFFLNNTLPEEDGFIYGFYDNREKEFLGRTISYVNLVERGLDNVYIAVCAIDADGNTLNTQDYIGPTPSTTFKPVNIPLKILAPVYSVSYKNSSYIRVGNIQSDLGKHAAWPLAISNGSFVKKFTGTSLFYQDRLPGEVRAQVEKDYYAIYNTVNIPQVNWSSIYGFGHYDIKSESPIIVSDRAIKTRLRPILNWNHPVDYSRSVAGVTVPEVLISIRETIDSEWEPVPLSAIRAIDCDTGIIEFNQSIIKTDFNLTKVDYSILSKDSFIYQVDGIPVPLNPILNSLEIKYNKPLYIYINPIELYYSRIESDTEYFAREEGYISTSPVNFTYDNSIFNPNSRNYNKLALPIAIIYSVNSPRNIAPNIVDLRTRGGGMVNGISRQDIKSIGTDTISYWDVYSPTREAYAKGGYVVIRIPEEVRDNFTDSSSIYDIIRNNLTAGVIFELQNMDGENWRAN